MIIFGGLVALLLIVRPRGLLDEKVVHQIAPAVAPGVDAHDGWHRDEEDRNGHPARRLLLAICCAHGAWSAEVRAKADVTCKPTEKQFEYDCTIKLSNARTGEPLTDVTLTVGADMPSMPLAHNVRPVKAQAGPGARDLSGAHPARNVRRLGAPS